MRVLAHVFRVRSFYLPNKSWTIYSSLFENIRLLLASALLLPGAWSQLEGKLRRLVWDSAIDWNPGGSYCVSPDCPVGKGRGVLKVKHSALAKEQHFGVSANREGAAQRGGMSSTQVSGTGLLKCPYSRKRTLWGHFLMRVCCLS